MFFLHSSTPATVPVPAPAPGGAGSGAGTPAIQLSDLQSILSNMQVPAGEGGGSAWRHLLQALCKNIYKKYLQVLAAGPPWTWPPR